MPTIAPTANTTDIGSIQPITAFRAPEGDLKDPSTWTTSFETYLSDIIGVITILGALFFIVYSFLAAFQWVTAGEDSGKVESAKNRFIWGTLGLILIVASYAIIRLIGTLVGIELLEPGALIQTLSPSGDGSAVIK